MEDRSVPAVVFTDTYTWNEATVTVTVDDSAPGYPGLYHWNYHVHNDSFGSGMGAFAVPVELPGMASNLGSSAGWMGSPGGFLGDSCLVSWQGAPLGVGQAANFWFTTIPVDLALTNGIVSDPGLTQFPGGFLAVPTAAPAPPGPAPMPALLVATNADKDDPNKGLTSLREVIIWVDRQNLPAQQFQVRFSGSLTGPNSVISLGEQLPQITRNIFINGAGRITIQRAAVEEFRLIEGSEDSTIKIAGLTLMGGGGDTFGGTGGAIRTDGTLTLQGCGLVNNTAFEGGGVYATGDLLIEDCTIADNHASNDGGGVYAGGNLTLKRGRVFGNAAMNAGGGIFANGETVTIQDAQIDNNEAGEPQLGDGLGGGLYIGDEVASAGITGVNTKIFGNTATVQGGGIYVKGNDLTTVILEQCAIYWNNAQFGAGMAVRNGVLRVISTSITENGSDDATDYGGGVYIGSRVSEATFTSSTIANNSATISGGGIWIAVPQDGISPVITLDDTWVSGNSAVYTGAGIGVASAEMGGNPQLVLKGDTQINFNTLTGEVSMGAGLYLGRGSVTFDGVTFYQNTADFATGFYAASGTQVTEGPGGVTYIWDTWYIAP